MATVSAGPGVSGGEAAQVEGFNLVAERLHETFMAEHKLWRRSSSATVLTAIAFKQLRSSFMDVLNGT